MIRASNWHEDGDLYGCHMQTLVSQLYMGQSIEEKLRLLTIRTNYALEASR